MGLRFEFAGRGELCAMDMPFPESPAEPGGFVAPAATSSPSFPVSLLAIALGALFDASASDAALVLDGAFKLVSVGFVSLESPALYKRDDDLPEDAAAAAGAGLETLGAGWSGGMEGFTEPGGTAGLDAP